MHADNPAGEWSDPLPIDQQGIDPSLLFHNGKAYFATTATYDGLLGTYLSEIDVSSGQRLTEPRFLWGGVGARYPEAPHLYPKDGWCYLVMAEGGTEFGHMVTIARSRGTSHCQ